MLYRLCFAVINIESSKIMTKTAKNVQMHYSQPYEKKVCLIVIKKIKIKK